MAPERHGRAASAVPERRRGRRLLLAVVLALAGAAVIAPAGAAAAPGGAALDLRLERTPVILQDAYFRLPPIGPGGAMGGNLVGGGFEVADQYLGDLYVRAGLLHGNPTLIQQGLEAFDYAFKRQRRDGSFGESQPEAYAFFVEAVAHSGLLLRQSPYWPRFRSKLKRHERNIKRAAGHMVKAAAWAGFKSRNRSYTHSGYVTGTALALTGKLANAPRLMRFGHAAIRGALDNQWRSGVNPELGGYDVRYQMAGLVYAERYTVYFPSGGLTRRVEQMTNRGLDWMQDRVASNGYIKWRGSTRACRERNSLGNPKTPGYAFAVRGFAYWGALEGRVGLIDTAQRMDTYSNQVGGDSLCGPKQQLPAAARGGAARDGGRPEALLEGGGDLGTLGPGRTSDLVE